MDRIPPRLRSLVFPIRWSRDPRPVVGRDDHSRVQAIGVDGVAVAASACSDD